MQFKEFFLLYHSVGGAKSADADAQFTAGRTAAATRGTTVSGAQAVTATLTATARNDRTTGATLSVTASRDGSVTLTTPSGTTITTTASLTSQVLITRYAGGARTVTAGFSADLSVTYAGGANLAIGATLSADAAKGLLVRQLDITALLAASAQVLGQTGGNTWTTALLSAVASIHSDLTIDDLVIAVDREVSAANLAPAETPEVTTAVLSADVNVARGVAIDWTTTVGLSATATVTANAQALLAVGVQRSATVGAAYRITAELQASLAPTSVSADTQFRPRTPVSRTLAIPAEIRSVVVGREDRTLRVPAATRSYTTA